MNDHQTDKTTSKHNGNSRGLRPNVLVLEGKDLGRRLVTMDLTWRNDIDCFAGIDEILGIAQPHTQRLQEIKIK